MGIPVVSTRLTGIPELVDDGSTGLLVPERDPAALAAALTRLLSDPALCASMGGLARIKAEREFDLRENVTILHQWFEGAAPQERSAGSPPISAFVEEPTRENPVPVR